jgi:hypothetical protein
MGGKNIDLTLPSPAMTIDLTDGDDMAIDEENAQVDLTKDESVGMFSLGPSKKEVKKETAHVDLTQDEPDRMFLLAPWKREDNLDKFYSQVPLSSGTGIKGEQRFVEITRFTSKAVGVKYYPGTISSFLSV